jgi:uncharacterized protein with beta-barrel porin domain
MFQFHSFKTQTAKTRTPFLLMGAAAFVLFAPLSALAAPCATTGNIAANCDLQSNPTGNITINNAVTVTMDGNLTLGNLIDGNGTNGFGIITTKGTGWTINQTGLIGSIFTPNTLTVSATDIWNASADMTIRNVITVNGTMNLDGSGASVVVDSTNSTVTLGANGVMAVNDSTNTVAIGTSHGISAGNGSILSISDGNDLFMGDMNGAAAGQGTLDLNDDYTLTGNVGLTNRIAVTDVAGGTTLTTDGYTLHADTIAVNAAAELRVTNSSTATGAIALGAGATLRSADNSFIYGDITGDGGVQTINLINAETLGQAGDTVDLGGGDDVVTVDGFSLIDADLLDGGAGVDSFATTSDLQITSDIAGFEDFSITNAANMTVNGNVTGGAFTLGAGSTLTIDATGNTVTSDVDGATGGAESQTLTLTAGTLSGAANLNDGDDILNLNGGDITSAIDMGAGNDTVNANGTATLSAPTLDGGTGTDTFHAQQNIAILSDMAGFEGFNVDDGVLLEFDGNVTGGTVTLGDTAGLLIDGGTVTSAVNGVTGASQAQTVTVASGALSGAVDLGDGDDTLNMNGGDLTGAVDFGTGNDSLAMGGNLEISAAMAGLESLNVGGNVLTVGAAIAGLDDGFGNGVNVNAGTLAINGGGALDGGIFDSNGSGSGDVIFGADTLGGTFDLGGTVDDVSITVTSGTLDTNGFDMGATEALGDIDVASGATFHADDNVTSGGAFQNAGTIRFAGSKTLTADTMTAAAGTYSFVVNSVADHGSFILNSGAFDMTGATIAALLQTDGLVDGDEVKIIDGALSVVGGPGATPFEITDNSALWKFFLVDGTGATAPTDDTDLFLKIEAVQIAALASGANNIAAANALQNIAGSSDPQVQAVLAALDGAGSSAAANEIIEATQATVDAGDLIATQEMIDTILGITDDRLAAFGSGEAPQQSVQQQFRAFFGGKSDTSLLSGNPFASLTEGGESGMVSGALGNGVQAWAQGFGHAAVQDRRGGIDGYSTQSKGLAAGVETTKLFKNTMMGLAVSYADADVASHNANSTDTEIDHYQVTLYADRKVGTNSFLSAAAGYGWSDSKATRHNVGGVSGLEAQGKFDAKQFLARLGAGHRFAFRGFKFIPSVKLDWARNDSEDYTETGAGGMNLHVSRDSLETLKLGTRFELKREFATPSGLRIAPAVHAGYTHDFFADGLETTSRFAGGGGAFRTNGADPAQDTFDIGAYVSLYGTQAWMLQLGYDYSFREDYDSHDAIVRVTHDL